MSKSDASPESSVNTCKDIILLCHVEKNDEEDYPNADVNIVSHHRKYKINNSQFNILG